MNLEKLREKTFKKLAKANDRAISQGCRGDLWYHDMADILLELFEEMMKQEPKT